MTGEQFMKRASVLIIGASIVLAVWWKTEPAAEREKRGVILPTAVTAEEITHEQETGEKGLFEALQGEPETDGGDVRGRDPEGEQDLRSSGEVHGRYAGGAAEGAPDHDGADGGVNELSAIEEDTGSQAETEAAVVPADDVETASASAPVEMETAGAQTGAPEGLVHYAVNGVVLSPYLQEYLYGQLSRYGAEWFFPVALCQIYQESRYKADAQNPNGQDKGLCQFREQFWEYHAKLSGLYEYDIWNPIDQLWVYAWLMAQNLQKSGGDIGMALSRYYLGEATYSETYVTAVMQWFGTMEVR